jgi:hypothetical protein
MLHKTMIVLLTAAALTGGLTADAFARGGGGDAAGVHEHDQDLLRALSLKC